MRPAASSGSNRGDQSLIRRSDPPSRHRRTHRPRTDGEETEGLELSVTRDNTRTLVARVAPVVTTGRGAVLVMHDITELRQADLVRRDSSPTCRTSCGRRSRQSRATPKRCSTIRTTPTRARSSSTSFTATRRGWSASQGLLRLARLDAGQERSKWCRRDVAGLLRGITNDFEPIAAQKARRSTIDVAGGCHG